MGTQLFTNNKEQVGNHIIAYSYYSGKEDNPVDRTFILQHGAFCTKVFMDVLAHKLVQIYPNSRIISVDAPWHGESVGPEDELANATVHTYADILADFVAKKREDNTIVGKLQWIGWSMGGSIGLLLNLKGVEIDELTLLNSSAVWHKIKQLVELVPDAMNVNAIKQVFYNMLENDFKTNMIPAVADELLANYDILTALPEVMVNDIKAVHPDNYDIRNQLKDITAKTLIVSGIEDKMAEEYLQVDLNESIKDSMLLMLNDNHSLLVKDEMLDKVLEAHQIYFG